MLSSKLFQWWTSVPFCFIISLKRTRCLVTAAAVLVLLIKTDADHRDHTYSRIPLACEQPSMRHRHCLFLRKLRAESCKSQFCCLQQIEWRPSAASSSPLSHFLWHRAFRQNLSVSFVLSLIYSFKQWQPHSKTMAHKLWVELTPIIMQIWGKKSPIVTHSSKIFPPPVLDIQVNKLLNSRKYSIGSKAFYMIWMREYRLYISRSDIFVYGSHIQKSSA